jgi:hypothetical protein
MRRSVPVPLPLGERSCTAASASAFCAGFSPSPRGIERGASPAPHSRRERSA